MHITVTDKDFAEKVLKSDKPILVDFWAEWCVAPDTHIYINQHEGVPAKRVNIGQKLISWNNKINHGIVTYSKSTVDAGHCRLIQTVSGRSLKVTDDHQIYAQRGWINADELTFQDKVAVLPVVEPVSFKGRNKILVTSGSIKKLASQRMQIDSYIAELKEKSLLPLNENHPQILVVARLIGALFSDGSLYQGKNNYREMSFFLGRMEDVKAVITDLKKLGFIKFHINKRKNQGKIGDRSFTQQTFSVKCLSTSLYLLLRALGVPEGSKLSQEVRVPKWIKSAPQAIKREFLAGILGGDGPKLTILLAERPKKLPYNHLLINDFEFHKQSSLITNGLSYAKDLAILFSEFGVNIKKIFVENEKYKRQDGQETVTIHLKFAHDFNTGYALAQKIGYAYSKTKAETTLLIGEFLRVILTKRKAWQRLYEKALILARKKTSVKKIAEKLSLPYETVFGWLKQDKKATVAYHLLKFPQWLEKARDGLNDGFIWEELLEIRKVYLPTVQKIMVTPTHNFVANGLLVHNCGPCRMQNPILEDLDKDLGEKGVIAKLNVDENPNTAMKFGVMSIPTLMLFHKGQVVRQWIGVQSKEALNNEFQKLIE